MAKYLFSVFAGLLGAIMILVFMPIMAVIVLVAGLFGQIKFGVNIKEKVGNCYHL